MHRAETMSRASLILVVLVLLLVILLALALRARSSPSLKGILKKPTEVITGAFEPPDDVSPPVVVRSVPAGDGSGRTFFVVDDGALPVGTKQRVAAEYVRRAVPAGTRQVIYSGSYNGYGPAATALGANVNGLKAVLVLSPRGVGGHTASKKEVLAADPVAKARELGAKVIVAKGWKDMNRRARKLAKEPNTVWLKLGLLDDTFVGLLRDAIADATQNVRERMAGRKLWVVGGVGALGTAIAQALPDTEIVVVAAVNRKVDRLAALGEDLPNYRVVPHGDLQGTPPYATVQGYDSLAWDAALADGADGDFIWNTAASSTL